MARQMPDNAASEETRSIPFAGRLQKLMPSGALLLLSLLWACRALVPDLLPNWIGGHRPSLLEEAIPFAILALITSAISAVQHTRWPTKMRLLQYGFVSIGLFVAPVLLVRIADTQTTAYARTVLFTLAGVFAVVLEPYLGRSQDPPLRGALAAALIATIGSLFVFPFEVPASIESALALGLVVVAAISAAAASCRAYVVLKRDVGFEKRDIDESSEEDPSTISANRYSALAAVTMIAATGALALAIAGGILRARSASSPVRLVSWANVAHTTLFELPSILLLLWLLPRIRPSRAATRYVFAPLFTVLLGTALLRFGSGFEATLQPRTWLGLVLMASGATYLQLASPSSQQNRPEPLGLRRDL